MHDQIARLVEIGKPVLVTDIDGVLSSYYETLVAESEQRWGKVYGINEDHTKIWGVSYDEGLRRLRELREDGFYGRIDHDADSVDALRDLSHTHTIITATSRSAELESITNEWLGARYGDSISLNIHTGIFDDQFKSYEQQLRTTKASLLTNLGTLGLNIEWFIDDEPKHAHGASSEAGIPTIHISKHWHTPEAVNALPASVVQLDSWKGIHAHIRACHQELLTRETSLAA